MVLLVKKILRNFIRKIKRILSYKKSQYIEIERGAV